MLFALCVVNGVAGEETPNNNLKRGDFPPFDNDDRHFPVPHDPKDKSNPDQVVLHKQALDSFVRSLDALSYRLHGPGMHVRSAAFPSMALAAVPKSYPRWCYIPFYWGNWECDSLCSNLMATDASNDMSAGWYLNGRARMWTWHARWVSDQVCVNGWEMQEYTQDLPEYSAKVTRCGNTWDKGNVQSIVIQPDTAGRTDKAYGAPLFSIRVETKMHYCLTFMGKDNIAKFKPCVSNSVEGPSLDQLWFVPFNRVPLSTGLTPQGPNAFNPFNAAALKQMNGPDMFEL